LLTESYFSGKYLIKNCHYKGLKSCKEIKIAHFLTFKKRLTQHNENRVG